MTITIKENNKEFTLTKKEYQDYNAWKKKQESKREKFEDKLRQDREEKEEERMVGICTNTIRDYFLSEEKYPTTIKEWILKGDK